MPLHPLRSLFLLAALALPGTRLRAQPAPFPWQPGTRWTYRIDRRLQQPGRKLRVRETRARQDMEVLRSAEEGGLRLVLLRGCVLGCILDHAPGAHLLVLDGEGRAFHLDGTQMQRLTQRDPALPTLAEVQKALKGAEPFLNWPMRVGAVWPPREPGVEEGMNQWRVEGIEQRPPRVPGWKGGGSGLLLAYRTNPDHDERCFVPELGFTRLVYVHHGTVMEYEATLTGFRPPRKDRPPSTR